MPNIAVYAFLWTTGVRRIKLRYPLIPLSGIRGCKFKRKALADCVLLCQGLKLFSHE
jgi:hypothetical protein